MRTKAAIKKAAAVTAAEEKKLHNKTYPKSARLSSIKYKLLVEIRGLVGSLHNPFLSQAEKETCKVLFYSTIRKLIVLQNGFCDGCGCAESKNSLQVVSEEGYGRKRRQNCGWDNRAIGRRQSTMSEGWIKVHRQWLENPIAQRPYYGHLQLLGKAGGEDE